VSLGNLNPIYARSVGRGVAQKGDDVLLIIEHR
jgi:hypothetical protein